MNAMDQLAEYRKKQAQRFQEEDSEDSEEENKYEIEEVKALQKEYDEEERKKQEQLDLAYSQKLERAMNFRETYRDEDDLEENKNLEVYDEIGDEGVPAQVPAYNQYDDFNSHSINYSPETRETYVKQDPPRWLVHPVRIDRQQEIKVFDFTQGSTNNELRMTADTDTRYEFSHIEDPALKCYNVEKLEAELIRKQKKRNNKFEKEEEKRIEEAERSGSIIENLGNSGGSDDSRGSAEALNEPLLYNNNNQQPQAQGPAPAQPNAQGNNQNAGQARTYIPGLVVRQADGSFRICCLRDLSRQFLAMIFLVVILLIICGVLLILF